MPFDELPFSDRHTVPSERPFEGEGSGSLPLSMPPFVTYLYPELHGWLSLLARLAVPVDAAALVAEQARRNRTDFQSELIVSGLVSEAAFYRALARELRVTFVERIDPNALVVRESDATALLGRRSWQVPVKLVDRSGGILFLLAPERFDIGAKRARIERSKLRSRLRITTPTALRAALGARVRHGMAKTATSDLFDRYPAFSGRIVATVWQGWLVGAVCVGFPIALALAPRETWMAVHLVFSLFFLACVGLRFAALGSGPAEPPRRLRGADAARLPVYSVLIALHKEAAVVSDLVEALSKLVWPRSKLEVKLVCEKDDRPTIEALRGLNLPPWFEVVEVPVHGPRTKPKALAFALPLASGEFVALYDAEDHPHPLQLLQAWQAFNSADDKLACVQAPLEISNQRGDGFVAMMFAFEYAALFRGLLPWLSRKRLVLPLGGTSNHFRRDVLEKVGGWDPYNVTEDADLGVRMTRLGYRTETIACPTHEEAPNQWQTWVPQRTRWFKGWLHTWLVHMRNPFRLLADVGFGSFLVAQILFLGLVVSALAHPVLVVTAGILAISLALQEPFGTWRSALFAVDMVNISCGYVSFLLLGWQTLAREERKGFWKVVLATPVYWAMMSYAAWRAVFQLWRKPHLWEKTPHRPLSRRSTVAANSSGKNASGTA